MHEIGMISWVSLEYYLPSMLVHYLQIDKVIMQETAEAQRDNEIIEWCNQNELGQSIKIWNFPVREINNECVNKGCIQTATMQRNAILI